MKKILFVVNAPEYLVSHRLPVAQAAKCSGFEVHIAAPAAGQITSGDGRAIETIEDNGFIYHEIAMKRGGQNPFHELLSIIRLYALLCHVKPDLLHLVTIKPVLYGGIAARLAGVERVVSAVAGLGTLAFAESRFAKIRRWFISFFYRQAFIQKNLTVIFQNPEDRRQIIQVAKLSLQRTRIIRGSGVRLEEYPHTTEPKGEPVVVMAARLLRDKGVFEFVEAARILKSRGVAARLRLFGSIDPGNPSTVTECELQQWIKEGVVELPGYCRAIAAEYSAANIVCLPSYREGLPKSLIEAAACGRAVVTSDVPGCRDAIEPGITGILVPTKNSVALADAIQSLIESPERRMKMGLAGRALAENCFSIEKIVNEHMTIYRELLVNE
jgi:glycosyltransferase involved in cell wall biosynthesis